MRKVSFFSKGLIVAFPISDRDDKGMLDDELEETPKRVLSAGDVREPDSATMLTEYGPNLHLCH